MSKLKNYYSDSDEDIEEPSRHQEVNIKLDPNDSNDLANSDLNEDDYYIEETYINPMEEEEYDSDDSEYRRMKEIIWSHAAKEKKDDSPNNYLIEPVMKKKNRIREKNQKVNNISLSDFITKENNSNNYDDSSNQNRWIGKNFLSKRNELVKDGKITSQNNKGNTTRRRHFNPKLPYPNYNRNKSKNGFNKVDSIKYKEFSYNENDFPDELGSNEADV